MKSKVDKNKKNDKKNNKIKDVRNKKLINIDLVKAKSKGKKHADKNGTSVKEADRIEFRKQMLLKLMQENSYVPMKEKELAVLLQVSKKDRDELSYILKELLKEGLLNISKRGKYSISKSEYFKGIFRATQQGFGFVEVDGFDEEFFVPESDVHGAMHLDTVKIKPVFAKRGKRAEASVIEVLERATNIIVGTFEKAKINYGFVVPDNTRFNKDIFIPVERSMGAVDGHKVVVEITDYGSKFKSPEGRIIEILGHENDPGVDILSIIKGYNLPLEFPKKVMKQAEKIEEAVKDEDIFGRLDLRDVTMVTIDSEEAKDLDDAVSLYMDGDDYVLGVHIADVSEYVQEASALDKEALKRGTSVYLVDRVIPMLPHRLSNGICSLNESVDRLTLSCIMTFDRKGNLLKHKIAESVIKTNKRMTYTAVNGIIENKDKELCEEYNELVPMFLLMKELADILKEKRRKRGSVDFDLAETKIVLDENGEPIDIKPYERNSATGIIEEFMLAANETVAEHFCRLEIPFVYRIHENPDPEKIRKLEMFIRNYGYGIKTKNDEVAPGEIQKLLRHIEGTPQEALISRLTLRSMQRARYSTDCKGHFGLACMYYCHFTSPIRRYPDLQIHRIIKEKLHHKLNKERLEHYNGILNDVASQSSSRERLADEAERETDKLKKAQYMSEHIGDVFAGVISGVTNWGIYVELSNTVEGLVHISKIEGDYYYFNEDSYELIGEHTGKRYILGQTINVKVNAVDMSMRTIDFVLE
ncbi:MAG: ribonuclease R [Lachnospiraceae bacterium]|nr:ribonuclease R [Lachnospiraceae bacterium]